MAWKNLVRKPRIWLTYGIDIFAYVCYRYMQKKTKKDSLYGTPEFYDNALFPWVPELERAWPAIRKELDGVLTRLPELPDYKQLSPSVYRLTEANKWRLFSFQIYGKRFQKNCELCPVTAGILEKIPGLKTGQFSILTPGTHLVPHKGPYSGVLRCHLGLLIPPSDGNLWIKVGKSQRTWEEGKVMIFDETFTHEARNDTGQDRAVLFIDFKRPLPPFTGFLNEMMLRLIGITSHIKGVERGEKEWEKAFYKP